MTTREQLEAVLNQHKVKHGYGSVLVCDELLDALVACLSQPSREELEKRLRWHLGEHADCGCKLSMWNTPTALPANIIDDLMSWAQGQETKRCCCKEHHVNFGRCLQCEQHGLALEPPRPAG